MNRTVLEIEEDIRRAARKCSLAARGLWDVFRDQVEFGKSDRDGHLMQECLPLTLEAFSLLAKSSPEEATRLLQELVTWGLVDAGQSHGAYHSPLLSRLSRARRDEAVRSEEVRRLARDRQQRRRAKIQAKRHAPVTRDTRVTGALPARDSPPGFSLPITLSLPNPLFPNPTDSVREASLAELEGKNAGKRPASRRRERKYSDAQVAAKDAFWDWWAMVWPRFHRGDDYEFEGARDGGAIWKFLAKKQIDWNIDRAKEVATYYLNLPEMYGLHDHPLVKLAARANPYARELDRRRTGGSHAIGRNVVKPTAVERGQFASDFSALRSESSDDARVAG